MDETRAQAYANLIQQLLSCPKGEERQILQDNLEWVDAGFLQACEIAADNLAGEGQENAADFLRNLASQLGQFLGIQEREDGDNSEGEDDREYARFILELLQAEEDSKSDVKVIYPLLRQRQHLLNRRFSDILQQVAENLIAEHPEAIELIVSIIENLSIHIYQFPLGKRANNIEIAIASYQIVLSHRQPGSEQWAGTQNNLGNAYSDKITGNQAENIDTAIACYQEALAVYTREDFPKNWATTQNNLANAYRNKITGNRPENIDTAIACYQKALEVRTREDFPQDWAMTQNNLANAYRNKITGNRAENIDTAIACYQEALALYTREDFPKNWATTQNNLANAYSNKITDNRAENIDTAIACYQEALAVYTREDFPENWAGTQNNLANAYSNKITGNRAENIDTAIACYQEALAVYTREDFPENWAGTQNNLANAYSNKITDNRAENIDTAIACYQEALAVYTREDFPENWAGTQNNLGLAYSDKITGNRAENIDTAIKCFRQALEIQTPSAFPLDCLQTGRNLGIVAFDLQDWENAIYGYENAITAVEQSRDWSTSQRSKRQILENALPIYEKLVLASINAERYETALLTVERSKSRTLIELLDNANLYPKNATDDQKQRLSQLRRQIASLQQQLDSHEPPAETDTNTNTSQGSRSISTLERPQTATSSLETELKTRQQQLAELLIEINDPDFTLTQRVIPQLPDFTQFLDSQTALIEWYLPPNPESGFHAFIVTRTRRGSAPVPAPNPKGATTGGLPLQIQIQHLAFTPEHRQQLNADIATYLSDYNHKSTWGETLSQHLLTLAPSLHLNQILAQLPPTIEKLILIPHCDLHLLPLHALSATRNLPNGETKTDYLLDLYPNGVQYAPSSQFLERLHQRQRPPINDIFPLFAIQNPTEDLRYTEIEVEEISRAFNPHAHILKRREATKIAFNSEGTLKKLTDSYYAHFSCHGSFNSLNPLDSALVLAGDLPQISLETPPTPLGKGGARNQGGQEEEKEEKEGKEGEGKENQNRYLTLRDGRRFRIETQCLTLKEIFASLNLPLCRLVSLSACETGLVSRVVTDEYIGLASGFLYAGAGNVVSSLWSVSDFSTAFLMIRFYQNLRDEKLSVCQALQAAQNWLRNLSRDDFLTELDALKLEAEPRKEIDRWLRLNGNEPFPFANPVYWAAFCTIGL